MFAAGQQEKILDTYFYAYLAATVRTKPHDFFGRLNTVGDDVADAERLGINPKHILAAELHRFLCSQFTFIIERKKGSR
jgi:hypothetical protein